MNCASYVKLRNLLKEGICFSKIILSLYAWIPADGICPAAIPYSLSCLIMSSSASLSGVTFSGFCRSYQSPLLVNLFMTSSLLYKSSRSIFMTILAIIICYLRSPLTRQTAISAILPFLGSTSVISMSKKHIGLLI